MSGLAVQRHPPGRGIRDVSPAEGNAHRPRRSGYCSYYKHSVPKGRVWDYLGKGIPYKLACLPSGS